MEKKDWDILKEHGITPDNLVFEGDLYLDWSEITELPEGLEVRGSAYLGNSKIKKLPKDLRVLWHLDLNGSEITELPKGLVVGRCLNLEHTQIKKLPADLIVGYIILNNTKVKVIPDTVTVKNRAFMSEAIFKQTAEGKFVEVNPFGKILSFK